MTDSLERFLHDLQFEVPAGLVDRAMAAAVDAPAMPRPGPGEPAQTSRSVDAMESEVARPALLRQRSVRNKLGDGYIDMGRRTELVAGIAAVAIAAIVIGTFAYIHTVAGLHSAAPATFASPDPNIKQYQALIAADQQRMQGFLSYECTVNPAFSSGCADAAAAAIGKVQPWLDDLNQTRPPARFEAIDARIRHHLALAVADLDALVAANKTMDESGAAAALAALFIERDTVFREANAVIFSSEATIRSYAGIVGLDNSNLLACDLCQRLVSQDQLSCQSSQAPSCADEVAGTRLQVETFQDDLVRDFVPNPLAAKDRRLQTDLLAADAALDAMDSALSTGDQLQFEAGRNALRVALNRVNGDATDIARVP